MNGGEDQVVLVKQWLARFVGCGARRIEGEVGQKASACSVAGGNALQLIEIAGTHDGIGIALFQMGLVPLPYQIELRRPIAASKAELCHQLDELAPGGNGLCRRRKTGQRLASGWARHVFEEFARG